jgi:hypothetical protein
MEKRYKKASKHRNYTENDGFDVHFETVEPTVEQPPVSQSMSGLLKPKTSDEAKIATLLARSNLLVTRDIEWANLVLGFEQVFFLPILMFLIWLCNTVVTCF